MTPDERKAALLHAHEHVKWAEDYNLSGQHADEDFTQLSCALIAAEAEIERLKRIANMLSDYAAGSPTNLSVWSSVLHKYGHGKALISELYITTEPAA